MDIDETKVHAGEYIILSLCSGRDFRGLGKEAEYLIMMASQGAEENAKHISEKTTRTYEAYQAMRVRVRDQFVLDVLGFGERVDEDGVTIVGPMSPQQAAFKLVESVWNAYIDWAKEAKSQGK